MGSLERGAARRQFEPPSSDQEDKMDNFLHRLKTRLIGEAGLIVFGIAGLAGTGFLLAILPILGVLFLAVITIFGWRFTRWI